MTERVQFVAVRLSRLECAWHPLIEEIEVVVYDTRRLDWTINILWRDEIETNVSEEARFLDVKLLIDRVADKVKTMMDARTFVHRVCVAQWAMS